MRTSRNHQQSGNEFTIFFTGGGTGGHVYPGIAVYDSLLRLADSRGITANAYWIGSKRGIEREIVESKGIRYIGIPSGKLRRYFSIRNLFDLFKVFFGIAWACAVTKRLKPGVLFSKGGYVSVPPVIGARLANVPVVTHESDLDPGLATRINARFAERVILSYEKTGDYFPDKMKPKLTVAGNPVRHEVLAGNAERGMEFLSLSGDKPLLLILGGSQGARELNELIWSGLPDLQKKWHVVHQTGPGDSGPPGGGGYTRFPYVYDGYADVLAAASLVVCRAGATTLWELAALGKPSILLPLGVEVSRGDQIRNAELFNTLGASYILKSGSAAELLEYTDRCIANDESLKRMGESAASVYRADASEKIAVMLLKIVVGENNNED